MKLTRLAIPMLALTLMMGGCAGTITTAGSIGQSLSTASTHFFTRWPLIIFTALFPAGRRRCPSR